ncbi:hypothetical protein [Chryseobacterium oncorhynchi]|uniref:Uncharacterized protein n=1 Tax=Chryseobacterium oncorhynchi TaxID=741074 RepID=A0A316WF38_9FLAO|nr:hypothetical protein [Chryseobacterium oncorhynchi]PWN60034.1 hypothetical protein C1638_020930 [Chryseobacterium oncorhynchi]
MKKRLILIAIMVIVYFCGIIFYPKYFREHFPQNTVLFDKNGKKMAEGLFTSDDKFYISYSTGEKINKNDIHDVYFLPEDKQPAPSRYIFPVIVTILPLILFLFYYFKPSKSKEKN